MGTAIFAGLWAAFADARWSYSWAKEREEAEVGDVDPKHQWNLQRGKWHKHKSWGEKASMISFALGVLVASIYIVQRAF